MSHGDRVETLAPGFDVVAASEGAPFAIATTEKAKRFEDVMPNLGHCLSRFLGCLIFFHKRFF